MNAKWGQNRRVTAEKKAKRNNINNNSNTKRLEGLRSREW